jgi:NAD(P)-dependent dehydrogenase (short-subunit alcohol dehydrogenase family)
MRGEE